jgi:hypothetical protein
MSLCIQASLKGYGNDYVSKRIKHFTNTQRSLRKLIKQNVVYLEKECDEDNDGHECDAAWERIYTYSKAIHETRQKNIWKS